MNIWGWIKAIFFKVSGVVGNLFKQVFTSSFQKFIALAMDVAKKAVSVLEGVDLTNDEKREAAFKEIVQYVEEKGIYYKKNWVYILIGIALEAIRNTASNQ
jgi:hypothetical protein